MPKTVRVRRDRPSALSWALALAVTMLAVYLITLTAPAAREEAAETAARGPRVTQELTLEGETAYFADLGCHADALLARTAAAQLAARGAAGVTYRDAEGIHVLGAAYRLEADAARIARQLSQREQLSAAVLELSAEPVSLRITAPEQDVQAIVDADSILHTQLKQIASMALQVDRGELSAESARTLAAVACSELDAARNQLEQISGAAEDTVCAGLLFQLERLSGGLEAVGHGAERGAALSGRLRSCHVDGLLNRIEWLQGLT